MKSCEVKDERFIAVRFEDEGGSATIARTDKSGNYELRYAVDQVGAPVGKHKVTILTPPKDEVSTGEREKEIVPVKYNNRPLQQWDLSRPLNSPREHPMTHRQKDGRQKNVDPCVSTINIAASSRAS